MWKMWDRAYKIYTQQGKGRDERRNETWDFFQQQVGNGKLHPLEAKMIFRDLTDTVDFWEEKNAREARRNDQ